MRADSARRRRAQAGGQIRKQSAYDLGLAQHLAALRAGCVRASGVRGLLGACTVAADRDR